MIIIGELLNSTRDIIKEKIENEDKEYLQDLAQKQEEAGSDYIDVNTGEFIKKEPQKLKWLARTVQEVVNIPLSLDTANPEALKEVLPVVEQKPLINSITAEKERFNKFIPYIKDYDTEIIALSMGEEGISEETDKSLNTARKLVEDLKREGIGSDKIFIDPLLRPISVNTSLGEKSLELIEKLNKNFPEVNITCGLSNISHGMPQRRLLNHAFLVMGMSRGLNSAILDPLDQYLMSLIKAARVLLNRDEFAAEYIQASRSGGLIDLKEKIQDSKTEEV